MQDIYDLEEFEQLENLHVAGRKAADIIADCMDKGPLHEYLIFARKGACDAMESFAFISIADTEGIGLLQARVRLYIDACTWAQSIVLDGKDASDRINMEFEGNEQREEFND